MIEPKRIQDILKLPIEERRLLLKMLQESLPEGQAGIGLIDGDRPSPAAEWLLSIAGRYSGGPGNTATRADEILRAEINKRSGLKTK